MKNDFNELAIAFKYDQTEKNYTSLYKALRKPLLKHISNFIKDKEVMNDIWQDVAVKIFQKIDMYNENFSFSTWIYTITRNECFIWLKSKENKNRISLSNKDESGIEITTTGDVAVLESIDLRDHEISEFDREEDDIDAKYDSTVAMIAEMDPKYRLFLEEKYIKGKKEKEISAEYGVRKSTVKNRLFHGRKKIQRAYAERNVSI